MQVEVIVQSTKFSHDKISKGLLSSYEYKDDEDSLYVTIHTDKNIYIFSFGISKEEKRNEIKKVFTEELCKETISIRVDVDRMYVYVNKNWPNQFTGNLKNIDSLVFDKT